MRIVLSEERKNQILSAHENWLDGKSQQTPVMLTNSFDIEDNFDDSDLSWI